MKINVIGGSNLTAINENIGKLESTFTYGYDTANSFCLDLIKSNYSEQLTDINSLQSINEEITTTIKNLKIMLDGMANTLKICDAICELYNIKQKSIQCEYNKAVKDKDGKLMTTCYQEIEVCKCQYAKYKSYLQEMLQKYESGALLYSRLYEKRENVNEKINHLKAFIFNTNEMSKEELVAKIYELRLLNMDSFNELINDSITKCKERLSELGYVWKNPYSKMGKKKLALERIKVFNQRANLLECSNTLVGEIINLRAALVKATDKASKVLEKRIAELESGNKDVMTALLLTEDKYNAIEEVLNV